MPYEGWKYPVPPGKLITVHQGGFETNPLTLEIVLIIMC
jgi:hypothetical protein